MGSINPEKNSLVELQHKQLGTILGRARGNDIVQFRGLPYATIPGRFRQSVLRRELPTQPYFALNPGSTCPQPDLPYFPYWEAPLPDDLPVLPTPVENEFACLNLSISVPTACLRSGSRKLPVLVFVHGGAFVGGSHSIQLCGREVFDPTGLIRHSIRRNKDMLVVGINYRVGPLGFLASQQLEEFNKSHAENIGNYGLHDQRQALQWLSEFISGFGGDPENITIQGTSAGAASCHYQTMFPDKKFRRAILASGTALGIGPLPMNEHQPIFDELCEVIAPENHYQDVLSRLLSCKSRSITHGKRWDVCHPLIEESYICSDLQEHHRPEMMIGYAAFEEDLAHLLLLDPSAMTPKSDSDIRGVVTNMCRSNGVVKGSPTLPCEDDAVLSLYRLNTSATEVHSWAHLLGNVIFDIPALYGAVNPRSPKADTRTWLYCYKATNTYPKSHSFQKAHHGINDLFVFNVAPEMIPKEDQASWNAAVEQTQRCWIDFVNGESPWTPVRVESSIAEIGQAGPVFAFTEDGQDHEYERFEDCVGIDQVLQYQSILNTCT